MSFWISNFWVDGFWVDNFWVGQEAGNGTGGSASASSKKKREHLDDIKEASRLALLRRRRQELLDKERERAQEAEAPMPAQEAQKRLFTIDAELEKIHAEITELETHIEKARKKRRHRDRIAALLLMN